jgi:glycosyltransferase involved in cell wall biosynthesis
MNLVQIYVHIQLVIHEYELIRFFVAQRYKNFHFDNLQIAKKTYFCSMRKKRIILSVTNDLETDQRVHKVATFFHNHNFDVLVVGRKLPNSKPLCRAYATKRMNLLFNKGFFFYAEFNIRLFFFLIFSRFTVLWANDTDTVLPNFLLSKLFKKVLFFDAHELFPELPELVERAKVKKVWKKIEDIILPRIQHSFTVCQSIADYYKNLYGIDMQVLRNVPLTKDISSYVPISVPKEKIILLYQGAVNVGRGLEQCIDAVSLLPNAVLYIVGDGDVLEQLKKQVADLHLEGKVFFTGKVPFEELPRYTKAAHIGLALLEKRGLSYYYALPNRMFDFIQADIPILASNFPEMARIINEYKVGKLLTSNQPTDISQAIQELYSEHHTTNNSLANFAKAKEELCWEKEQEVLSRAIQKLGFAN